MIHDALRFFGNETEKMMKAIQFKQRSSQDMRRYIVATPENWPHFLWLIISS